MIKKWKLRRALRILAEATEANADALKWWNLTARWDSRG